MTTAEAVYVLGLAVAATVYVSALALVARNLRATLLGPAEEGRSNREGLPVETTTSEA